MNMKRDFSRFIQNDLDSTVKRHLNNCNLRQTEDGYIVDCNSINNDNRFRLYVIYCDDCRRFEMESVFHIPRGKISEVNEWVKNNPNIDSDMITNRYNIFQMNYGCYSKRQLYGKRIVSNNIIWLNDVLPNHLNQSRTILQLFSKPLIIDEDDFHTLCIDYLSKLIDTDVFEMDDDDDNPKVICDDIGKSQCDTDTINT